MKHTLKSLLAAAGLATGLGLGPIAASALAAAPVASPFPSAPDDPSITAPSASQYREDPRGRHHRQHPDKRHDGMSKADREARRAAMDKLTTEEERSAFREQMRSATPEQRPQLMAARRAELEQRAKDRGVALPVMHPHGERHGHGLSREGMRGSYRHGMPANPATQTPAPASPPQSSTPAAM
ncbi:MAG: hypothetical protein ING90_03905 [Rhodocyclaceae bacterium]|jgi:hypothetical protein|nr:hypothetical protein [Rhodocyclaceae bacterium]MCE2978346.1 hypothetical protein [Betaproteobacteria bacterium]MCA3075412.1 hypothetical protein [Rhodocyclaceae bacterium]MCA3091897.1 hypothetical protein [Rhodocyclaceae bacterium]MCA3093209.1 hypothetical protein [Rhodocyclaceae bacterium]